MNDDTGSFDPSAYLDATTTEALTKRPPLPAGSDFVSTITDAVARSWTSNKPEAKVKSGIAVDLKIEIDMSAYPGVLKDSDGKPVDSVEKIILTPGIMLDMKDDGKSIDWSTGKNGNLRRYREALGMNNPGEPFSIRQMVGRQIRVKIKHRAYQGEFYDEVDSVAKA
jgi:hypothetical protein